MINVAVSIKQCKQCNIYKDNTSFTLNAHKCTQCKQHNKSIYNKQYYVANKDHLLQYSKEHNIKNPQSHQLSHKRQKEKNKNEPTYKIRRNVSRTIVLMLKQNNGSKLGKSMLSVLKYSIQQLKEHLEKQFEPWMSWGNYGKYNPKTWDDNDRSTWTWQIDHIIPQSKLQYANMEDDNFKKCWDLSNLRPLSAKQNLIDGCTKIRHC